MSDSIHNSVAIPVGDLEPDDGTAHGNTDAKATTISDEGYLGNFTPINSAANKETVNITPIKREASEDHQSEPPSKKRSTKKDDAVKAAKGSTKAKKSTATANGNTGGSKTTTPKKKRSLTEAKNENLDTVEVEKLTKTGQARQRVAPRNIVATPRPIPLSWDTADAADKKLVTMRDNGEDWGAIRLAWTEETGENPPPSTLPNRYSRIKARLVNLREGDTERILAAKAEVEAKFRAEKLLLIAACIEKAGGEKYSTLFLQRHLKEAENAGRLPVTKDDE